MSHRRAVLSSAAVMAVVLLAATLMVVIRPECPSSTYTHLPERKLQTLHAHLLVNAELDTRSGKRKAYSSPQKAVKHKTCCHTTIQQCSR